MTLLRMLFIKIVIDNYYRFNSGVLLKKTSQVPRQNCVLFLFVRQCQYWQVLERQWSYIIQLYYPIKKVAACKLGQTLNWCLTKNKHFEAFSWSLSSNEYQNQVLRKKLALKRVLNVVQSKNFGPFRPSDFWKFLVKFSNQPAPLKRNKLRCSK